MADDAALQKIIEALTEDAAALAEVAMALSQRHYKRNALRMLEAAERVLQGARDAAAVHAELALGALCCAPLAARDQVVRSVAAQAELSALRERKDAVVQQANLLASRVDITATHARLEQTMAAIEAMHAQLEQMNDEDAGERGAHDPDEEWPPS